MTDGEHLPGIRCHYCHVTGQVRIEFRDKYLPTGPHSLSGSQLKLSVRHVKWPWAICDNCGHESEGKQE